MMHLNINEFTYKKILKRRVSMFEADILENQVKLLEEIQNKSVLVIGGAGTIGSSFIKELLAFKPRSLVVVDINENGLTELTRDLRSTKGIFLPDEYITYPMNYSDSVFFKMFKNNKGFDIVANFSAHKHVRSEKDTFSVEALIKNNVINAKELLNLLETYPPKHFFCVSTDKASSPVNIMGGSKKIMEELIMSYSNKYPVTTARFANVTFSNGSLPEGFLNRILKKQPISAPDDIKRYFVSPEESGQICLLACILGKSGEIYFPKLDKEHTMTFSDLATKLLKELSFNIDICKTEEEALNKSDFNKNYPVYFSRSDTTGEKQNEEFFSEEEVIDFKRFKSLGIVVNVKPRPKKEIDNLITKFNNEFKKDYTTKEDIVKLMKDFLIKFDHVELGKNLDSKM